MQLNAIFPKETFQHIQECLVACEGDIDLTACLITTGNN